MSKCELCNSNEEPIVDYNVQPIKEEYLPVKLCAKCISQIQSKELDFNHFKVLNDTMWSENPSVQVLAYRLLKQLSTEQWAENLFDMLYLDDELMQWAEDTTEVESENNVIHKDCNGAILEAGDTVTLTKDLNVKGASFTAKRGTAVRRISLDPYNENHIEGRINGQKIVILTEFVKKSK